MMAKFVRKPEVILGLLKTENNQLIAKDNLRIHVPSSFLDKSLAEIGSKTYVYGCFPIINNNNEYGVLNICGVVEINPYKIETFTDDSGYEYHQFFFEKDTVFINELSVVVRNTLMYEIFNLFYAKVKIPWYLEYEDVCKLFDTSIEFAGTNIGQNSEIIEFFASIICRNKDDLMTYARISGKDYADFKSNKISYVPLQSIQYSMSSNLNKLAGNYFKEGIVSALTNTSDKVNPVERILRL